MGTPGRIVDHIDKGTLDLSELATVILDEADELLNLGFRKEVAEICLTTQGREATWLFSATIPVGVRELITNYMSPAAHSLKIDQLHVVNRDISHRYIVCKSKDKTDRIESFLRSQREARGVIFCRTRAGANRLFEELTDRGHALGVLQGDLMQSERDKVLRSFRKGRFQFLIATDVAARGIDVEGLAFVLHHQLPDQVDYYTHRSGRTGRAGRRGDSIVLICEQEKADIAKLGQVLGLTFTEMW